MDDTDKQNLNLLNTLLKANLGPTGKNSSELLEEQAGLLDLAFRMLMLGADKRSSDYVSHINVALRCQSQCRSSISAIPRAEKHQQAKITKQEKNNPFLGTN